MLVGLCFTLVYLGMFYILWDLIANRVLKPMMLVETILLAGLVVLIFGYLQIWAFVRAGIAIDRYLIFSTLDNPNILAGFLLILLPIIALIVIKTRSRAVKV